MPPPGALPGQTDSSMWILGCLERLNDKATQRAAADDLAGMVRNLDVGSMTVLVNNICNTGHLEPKPYARKESTRLLGILASPSCPVRAAALQAPILSKALAHIKKHMQDLDASVRDASIEALTALAAAVADTTGGPLPGSTLGNPFLRVVFDCLAEQKKESQAAAGQALLQTAHLLSPLDKDLVKALLRCLRSTSFQGSAYLLAALANTGTGDVRRTEGLLKHGAVAFLPYLQHFLGQSPAPNSSSGGGSGILGCLYSKDWAVRRAAADALSATALLLGPGMEPEGAWGVGDPASLTGRCLAALENARFDKVKEARQYAREAVGVLQELQNHAQQGGDDWQAFAMHYEANVLSAPGAASTQASSGPAAPVSVPSPSSAQRSGPSAMGRASSLTERFQRAATPDGLVAEPRPKTVGSSSGRAKWGQCDPAMLQLPGVDGEAGDPGAVQQGEDEGLIPAAWGEEREEEEAGPEMDANASARALQQRLEAALDRGVGALLTEASGSEVEGAAEEASAAANAATEVAAAEAAAPEAAAVPAEASGKQALRADARSTSVSSSAAAPRASAGSRRTSSSSTGNGSRRATADGQRGGAAAGAAAGVAAGMAGGSRRESAKQARTSNAVGSRRQTADCQGAQSGDGRSKPPTQSNARAAQKAAVVQQGAPAPKNGAAPQSLKEPKVDTQESQEPDASSRASTTVVVDAREWRDLQHQLKQLQQQQLAMATMLQQLTESSAAAIASLQGRILALEARAQPQQAQQVQQAQRTQQVQQQQQSPRQVVSAGRSAPGSLLASPHFAQQQHHHHQQQQQQQHSVGSPHQAAHAGHSSPGSLRAVSPFAQVQQQQQQQSSSPGGWPVGGVSRSMDDWAGKRGTPAGRPPVLRTGSGVSASASALAGIGALLEAGAGGFYSPPTPAAPCDVEAAYAQALRVPSDMHLLRLIMKTGPCWTSLSEPTAAGLLAAFIRCVRDGVMLHRVLPWLWRLADEDCRQPEVADDAKQLLLEALAVCPAADDVQTQEKVQLLIETLKSVWSSSQ